MKYYMPPLPEPTIPYREILRKVDITLFGQEIDNWAPLNLADAKDRVILSERAYRRKFETVEALDAFIAEDLPSVRKDRG